MPVSDLVTVAVSTYNVGDYIDEALKCIEEQSYTNIEILCIDDCSTDSTQAIIRDHTKKDARYRLICHNHNQGLSVSRNRAISEAQGEYIIMLDGDDLFDKDMVRLAVEKAEEKKSDIVLWDYAVFSNANELKENIKQSSRLIGVSSEDKLSLLRQPAFMWVKLIRTSVLKKLKTQFTPGLTKQDIPIHWQLVTSLDKISILPRKLSFYRQQPNATSCRKGKSLFSLAIVMDITEQYLKASGKYEKYKSEFLRRRLSLLQGMYDFIKPELKNEALAMVRERLNEDAKQYLASYECELTPRVRYFYGSLSGNLIDRIRYKSILYSREVYRVVKRILKR